MQRVPLLSGTRLTVAEAPDDAVVLRPPPPGEPVADVACRGAGRAPLPARRRPARGARHPRRPCDDRHRAARAAAPGRAARPAPGRRSPPPRRARACRRSDGAADAPRRRRADAPPADAASSRSSAWSRPALRAASTATVEVHDAEDPDLVELEPAGRTPLRVHPALLDTDLVLTVSAAETCPRRPGVLLGCGGAGGDPGGDAYSLLETGASQGWRPRGRARAAAREARAARRRVARPRPATAQRRRSAATRTTPRPVERIARSPFRLGFGLLPGFARNRVIHSIRRDLSATAAFAGPPPVAHAEALLRGGRGTLGDARRAARRDRDRNPAHDARTCRASGRTRCSPPTSALGLALRLWREAFPVVEGGTVILLHRFHRHFAHPTQQPYREIFHALRTGPREPEELMDAERAALADERAIAAYRAGRSCHPLLPFADWAGCAPALGRRRHRDRRGLPRRRGRPPARLRPGARPARSARARARHGRRPGTRGLLALPALLSPARDPVGRRLRSRRGTPCGPARSGAGSSRRRRAPRARSRARSRGRPSRAPSARSARPGGSSSPAR